MTQVTTGNCWPLNAGALDFICTGTTKRLIWVHELPQNINLAVRRLKRRCRLIKWVAHS